MWEKIKVNIWYIIVAILGATSLAVGGIFWAYLAGKIILIAGMIMTIASIFMSLNTKTLFWNEWK